MKNHLHIISNFLRSLMRTPKHSFDPQAQFTGLSANMHKTVREKKRQLFLSASAFLFFTAAMVSMVYVRRSEEALASRIAPDVLRFHVLANSDSSADQELKLAVKKMLIDTIYDDLKKELNSGGSGEEIFTKETLVKYIADHQTVLKQRAEDFMASKGFSYEASVRIESVYFPTKVYGDVVFPCGTYDAVRILLGKGEGKNWWCVLYPPLCFTDNASAIVPDSSKAELRNLLDEEDYRGLMKNRRVVFGDGRKENEGTAVHVRLRLLDLLTGI